MTESRKEVILKIEGLRLKLYMKKNTTLFSPLLSLGRSSEVSFLDKLKSKGTHFSV